MQDNQNEELKYVSLSEMLKFFQDFGSYDDIQDKTCNTVFEIIETPKRNDVAYENIEKMDGKNFTSYMIFLMAIRNKEVKEIVSKIKYIFEYIANNDSFLDNEHIEEHDVNIIYNDGKLEYDTFSYMIEDMDFKKNKISQLDFKGFEIRIDAYKLNNIHNRKYFVRESDDGTFGFKCIPSNLLLQAYKMCLNHPLKYNTIHY